MVSRRGGKGECGRGRRDVQLCASAPSARGADDTPPLTRLPLLVEDHLALGLEAWRRFA